MTEFEFGVTTQLASNRTFFNDLKLTTTFITFFHISQRME